MLDALTVGLSPKLCWHNVINSTLEAAVCGDPFNSYATSS